MPTVSKSRSLDTETVICRQPEIVNRSQTSSQKTKENNNNINNNNKKTWLKTDYCIKLHRAIRFPEVWAEELPLPPALTPGEAPSLHRASISLTPGMAALSLSSYFLGFRVGDERKEPQAPKDSGEQVMWPGARPTWGSRESAQETAFLRIFQVPGTRRNTLSWWTHSFRILDLQISQVQT
ncbi:hypothetical protein AAY473_010081 [Plecturocebus cupreus]